MSTLIIVESPTKAKEIGHILGAGYKVMASGGHVRDLPPSPKTSRFGIDLDRWEGEYEVIEGKGKNVASLKAEAKKADVVYLATDPDREGEAISWHLSELLGRSVKKRRVTWNEITEAGVRAGLANPREINMPMVMAQEARRFLDRVMGYMWSPWLEQQFQKGGLSAGRVQSVVARIIVDRDREIENFIPKPYGAVSLTATAHGKTFKAPLIRVGPTELVTPEKAGKEGTKVLSVEEAQNLVLPRAGDQLVVKSVDTNEKSEKPHAPFTSTSMAAESSRRLGLSTEDTMGLAQKLFEAGLITYHRTDTPSLSDEAVKMVREFIGREYGATYLPPKPHHYAAKGANAQEAHEACRPTSLAEKAPEKLQELQAKHGRAIVALYELIWQQFVTCQMAAQRYDATVALLGFGAGESELTFRANGRVVTFDGWTRVYAANDPDEDDEDGGEDANSALPPMKPRENVETVDCVAKDKQTLPPKRWTEAALTVELERLGIGRPATLAKTYSTIIKRGYVTRGNKGRMKNVLTSTDFGRKVIDRLVEKFAKEMDISYTAQMEAGLDEISHGKARHTDYLNAFWDEFKQNFGIEAFANRASSRFPTLLEKCPKCENSPIILVAVAGREPFACCSDSNCKTYVGLDRDQKPVFKDAPCPKCGKRFVTPGKFGESCAACGHVERKILVEKCPKCKKHPIVLFELPGKNPFGCCTDRECKTYVGVANREAVFHSNPCPKCAQKFLSPGPGGSDVCAACGHVERTVLLEKCPKCGKHPIFLKSYDGKPYGACGDGECKTFFGVRGKTVIIHDQPCKECGQKWVTDGKNGKKCAACGKYQEPPKFKGAKGKGKGKWKK